MECSLVFSVVMDDGTLYPKLECSGPHLCMPMGCGVRKIVSFLYLGFKRVTTRTFYITLDVIWGNAYINADSSTVSFWLLLTLRTSHSKKVSRQQQNDWNNIWSHLEKDCRGCGCNLAQGQRCLCAILYLYLRKTGVGNNRFPWDWE